MPRVRPDDFHVLRAIPGDPTSPVWARWWRHRDGSVSHQHYSNDGTEALTTVRHDRSASVLSLFSRKDAS